MHNGDEGGCLEDNSMHVASAYASLLGGVPSNIGEVLRAIIVDLNRDDQLSDTTKFLLKRLTKSQKIAELYRLAGERVDVSLLANTTATIAYNLTSVGYIFFRFNQLLLKNSFDSKILLDSALKAEVAFYLILAIPKLSPTLTLFTNCVPDLTLNLLRIHDQKSLKEYIRHLKTTRVEVDTCYENATWGCTRYEIATAIIRHFGVGANLVNRFYQAFSSKYSDGELNLGEVESNSEIYPIKLSQLWVKQLLENLAPPNITHKGSFYPERGDLELLIKRVESLKNSNSIFTLAANTMTSELTES
jgi:hypothetical protein